MSVLRKMNEASILAKYNEDCKENSRQFWNEMAEKVLPLEKNLRFKYVYDVIGHQVYDTDKAKSLKYLVDNLARENVDLRGNLTRNKLVLSAIVEDLEKAANDGEPLIIRKDYVELIKKEADLELLSDEELKELSE